MPTERAPQITVNWAKISRLASKTARVFLICPFFPDVHAFCAQVCLVGVAGKEPKQFFRDPAEGDSLCRNDGKAFAQIEARLITEMRDRTDAGAVLMLGAVLED